MTLSFDKFSNVIDGKLVDTAQTRTGINPATKEPLAPVPLSTQQNVDDAVAAAQRAGIAWAKTTLDERRQRLNQLGDAVTSLADEFANLIVREQGKPLAMAKVEAMSTVGLIKGAAELEFPKDVLVEDSKERHVITRYIPIGVCVGIIPWNFPLALSCFKLGPAMLAGNTLIIKPSPYTPYSGIKLCELAQQFFPPGVIQVISGADDLGPMLTGHPGVDKVSFTGSTATGIKVMQSCAKTLKRVTLELGGNDPAIILPDVDIEKVAPQVAAMALANSGQVCIAIKRIYVHSSIYKEFSASMAKHVQSQVVADGLEKGTTLGPVQNAMQHGKLKDLIASLDTEKLSLLAGDTKTALANSKGYYVQPILVDNPPDTSRIVREEPFGPVFPVMKWDTEEEVIRRANDTEDGLGASVWSKDLDAADRIAKQLQAGTVWINTHMQLQANAAFGGLKQSGLGTELGAEGLKAYCNVQTIHSAKL